MFLQVGYRYRYRVCTTTVQKGIKINNRLKLNVSLVKIALVKSTTFVLFNIFSHIPPALYQRTAV